jgi:hypothetical protein
MDPANQEPARQAQRACLRGRVVKVARFVGSAVGAAGRLGSADPSRVSEEPGARSTRIDEGAARLEILVIDVETAPSATFLEWIDKTSSWRMTPCHTHDASTMSASPSRTSTR